MPDSRPVNEKAVGNWLDILPAYVGFVLRFFKDPKGAFAAISRPGEISSDATAVLLGGIGLAYLIALAARDAAQPSLPLRLLEWIEHRYLPAAGAAVVVAAGILLHWLAIAAGKWRDELALDGTVEDTVNAAVGSAAIFVPVSTAVLVAFPGSIVAAVALGLFFFLGFPAAVAATHPNTSYDQAVFTLIGIVFVVEYLIRLFG